MCEKTKIEMTVRRIGGYLHHVVPVVDGAGKVVSYALKPLMVEFHPKDFMQIVVGASILAVPVAFTEETWLLGAQLPLRNVLALTSLSFGFIALFVLFNFYRVSFRGHAFEYGKRVVAIYALSLFVVGSPPPVAWYNPETRHPDNPGWCRSCRRRDGRCRRPGRCRR